MGKTSKKVIIRLITFFIIHLIFYLVMLFYLDLANGPLVLLFINSFIFLIVALLMIKFRNHKFLHKFVVVLVLLLLQIVIIVFAKPRIESFSPVKNVNKTEVMHLAAGDIYGTLSDDEKVRIYAGVPYAKAPIGDLRFREPQDLEGWDGVLDCTKFAPRAMQVDRSAVMDSLVDIYAMGGWHPNYLMNPLQDMSEDCLYLNIWRPNNDETNLPILVYIHGGSLTTGSSAFTDYNGETYAKNGVIMITISYRLGVFGYFAHQDLIEESPNNTTGNYGLLDQIKALEWVNDNAEYFGGDKTKITIAGESAGSSSVSAICASPLAHGLFRYAIGESSSLVIKTPPHTFRTLDEACEVGANIMEEFNCETIDDLRKVSAKDLVKTKYTNSQMTLDSYALPKTPYEAYLNHENNEEALLNGYNVLESDAFVVPTFLLSPTNKNNIKERLETYFDQDAADEIYELYKDKIEEDAFTAFNEIISVYWFINPHESWSNMAINNGVKVYRYQFTKDNGYYGTYHSGEMIYVYGNLYRSKHQFAYNESDYKLQDIMVKYFTNFIKNGNPNEEGLPVWNEYNSSNDIMELGERVGMFSDRYKDLYPIINGYIDREIERKKEEE